MVDLQLMAQTTSVMCLNKLRRKLFAFKSENVQLCRSFFYDKNWQLLGVGVIVCVHHILFVNNIVLNEYTN